MSLLTKRSREEDDDNRDIKKQKIEQNEDEDDNTLQEINDELSDVITTPPRKKRKLSKYDYGDDEDEEDEEDEEFDDSAKLYSILKDPNVIGAKEWKLDDNNDKVHKFFTKNTSIYGEDKWPNSKDFRIALKTAQDLENSLNGVLRKSSKDSSWYGFVLIPAFEAQEGQQAFEEALGLPDEILEAEAGLYFEDLDDESEMFVQEDDEFDEYSDENKKKIERARRIVANNLDDLYCVGFCSDLESCQYPEFWGGKTDEGLYVGVVATIYPERFNDDGDDDEEE